MEPTLIWILVSVLGGFVLALLLGRGLVPALRALKAGQSIREVGPKWHQGKSGTPTMGGIVFILSSLLCIVTGWHAMRETGDYKHLLVLALALMFGLIGFADDFIKVKKKRNLGLTGLQKLVLQVLAACRQNGSRNRNPAGIRMHIWRSRGQRFHRETATMSFHSTFTVPERKRTPAPSMNSVL